MKLGEKLREARLNAGKKTLADDAGDRYYPDLWINIGAIRESFLQKMTVSLSGRFGIIAKKSVSFLAHKGTKSQRNHIAYKPKKL